MRWGRLLWLLVPAFMSVAACFVWARSGVERTHAPLCQYSEVRRVGDPSGRFDLVVALKECGMRDAGHFSLVPRGTQIGDPSNVGSFLTRYNDPEQVDVRWDGSNVHLSVPSRQDAWLFDERGRRTMLDQAQLEVDRETFVVSLGEKGAFQPEKTCTNRIVSRSDSPNARAELILFERRCMGHSVGGVSVFLKDHRMSDNLPPNVTAFDLRQNPLDSVRGRWVGDALVAVDMPTPPLSTAFASQIEVRFEKPPSEGG